MGPRLAAASAVLALTLAGCALPVDPDGTLERVTGGELRVGVVHDPPWAAVDGPEPSGSEVDLVLDYAATIDAEVEWYPGGEERLVRELEHGRIDLLIGGLTQDTPWVERVGVTRPYVAEDTPDGTLHHVIAVPLGENGLLVDLERFLHDRSTS